MPRSSKKLFFYLFSFLLGMVTNLVIMAFSVKAFWTNVEKGERNRCAQVSNTPEEYNRCVEIHTQGLIEKPPSFFYDQCVEK